MATAAVAQWAVLTAFALDPSCAAQLAGQDGGEPALPSARVAKPPGETLRQLTRLQSLVDRQAWADVAKVADDLLSAHASGWVAIDEDHYCGVREAVRRRLTSLPAEGLEVYRRRVDPLAATWLEQGIAHRDERLLQKVVDEAFASSAGDDALWALGEIHLERGETQAARAAWSRVRPESAGQQSAYPDSRIPLAEVRARLALVAIREGHFQQAAEAIEVVRRDHGDARGRLGGEEAPLAEWLSQELAQARDAPPVDSEHQQWPALFGDGSRRNASFAGVSLQRPFEQAWTLRLNRPANADGAQRLMQAPVVENDVLYFQDGASLRAVQVADGKSVTRDERPLATFDGTSAIGPMYLSCAGDALVAVMPSARRAVGLDLSRDGAIFFDQLADGEQAAFAGYAVIDGPHLILCAAERDEGVRMGLVCYDLWTGEQVWRRLLGWAYPLANVEAAAAPPAEMACDGENVYVNTGLGMIAALRAVDGEPQWLRTYDRSRQVVGSSSNPPHLAGAAAIAAPEDSAAIHCIDAASGAVRWQAPRPSPNTQILAVDAEYALLQGDRLRRISLAAGTLDDAWGRDVPSTAGQGVVGGHLIFWPTPIDVMLVDRRTGAPTDQSLPLPSPGGAHVIVVKSMEDRRESRAIVLAAEAAQVTAFAAQSQATAER